jgi:hypothetical protein
MASGLLIGWREQRLMVALPGRAKLNLAHTRPSVSDKPSHWHFPLGHCNDAGG